MKPERIVRGRILDLQGQAISGVSVRVSRYHTLPYGIASEAPSWPGPATADEQGRFTIRGLDTDTTIQLETRSDRHAPQSFQIDPRDPSKTGEQVITLAPAQVIEVRTIRADDGKPLAGVWVNVLALQGRTSSKLVTGTHPTTEASRIISATGESFVIIADPPVGEPYLDEQTRVDWPKGALRQTVEIKLSRGIRVHGAIIEESSRQARRQRPCRISSRRCGIIRLFDVVRVNGARR